MASLPQHLVSSTEAALTWLWSSRRKVTKGDGVRFPWLDALGVVTWGLVVLVLALVFLFEGQIASDGSFRAFWRVEPTGLTRGQKVVLNGELATVWGLSGDIVRWSDGVLWRRLAGDEAPEKLSQVSGDWATTVKLLEDALERDPDNAVLRVQVARNATGTWVPEGKVFVQTSSGSRLVPRAQVHTLLFEVNHGR